MAKNNWINGDTFTRTSVNQPFWLASGTYNAGSDRIELQVSPGAIRYPWKPDVMYSGQAQPLLINNPQAAKYYSVFVRSDGSMMVSGTTALTPVPAPPRYDAEPLGIVFTGASLHTDNMVGPWNQGAFGTYEQRGQAVVAGQPQIVWREMSSTNYAGHVSPNTTSGLMFLHPRDYPSTRPGAAFLSATINWQPSGTVGADGRLTIMPIFYAGPMANAYSREYKVLTALDLSYMVPEGGTTMFTTTLTGILASGSFQGYSIYADLGAQYAGQAYGIYIRLANLSVITGLYNSGTDEPA